MMRSTVFLLTLGCVLGASAQVYQSTDEQGNPVFSDTPTTGSKAVEIPESNVGESVEVPPPPPPPQPVERPEIVPDREPTAVDGELIGERRDDSGSSSRRIRPEPYRGGRRGGRGHGR